MSRLIDLSFPIHNGIKTYPSTWHPKVKIQQMGRHHVEGRESRRIVLGTHTATHVDAASHFIRGGRTIENIPLSTLVGPARVVDLSKRTGGQEISLREVRRAVGRGRVERLLVRTGWSSHWKKRDYYTGYPYFSFEAARWLVERGVRLLGLDTPSPDNPAHNRYAKIDCPNHKVLLGKGVVLVEYLCNLHRIQKPTVFLIVMPLRLMGCDGSPARCAALEAGVRP